MGYKRKNARVIFIIGCLFVAAFFIHFRRPVNNIVERPPLAQMFSSFDGWQSIGDSRMDQEIVDTLKLDDYLYRTYSSENGIASLYIGYYNTSSKIGASHSPLVCFPGQGWEITVPEKIDLRQDDKIIHTEKLVVNKGQKKSLLLFWFQSYDKTSSGTFLQKVHNLWARLNSRPEDNAFVRVTVSIADDDIDEANELAVDFATHFYPVFLDYIISQPHSGHES